MLPTPAKSHYVFNLRDLSRVFQGVLLTPRTTVLSGGGEAVERGRVAALAPPAMMLALWRHECERAMCDKLTTGGDKRWFADCARRVVDDVFGAELAAAACGERGAAERLPLMINFGRDDTVGVGRHSSGRPNDVSRGTPE